ncbi:hypothetical protein M5W68_17005 [Paenibacillus larvae]|uniref:hypothetical protein n=1 Tax=Paenibacillus larvae TaxID=1464 RepID=UPI002281E566|nr:hypothetical protein [Paenibacillus larvae]MCY9512349.1 hypothetical protein [Paenibacillus larvae]MCY9526763.1 hypothetical protein [Paenibacillus larvae]
MEVLSVIIVILIVLFFIQLSKAKKRKAKQEEFSAFNSATLKHITGLTTVPQGENVDVFTMKDSFVIQYKEFHYAIPIDRVTSAAALTESEIVQKDKSVVGRAVVGSIFGPLGTIIGGASAFSGKGKKNAKGSYLVIEYLSADGESKIACFENLSMKKVREIADTINTQLFCIKSNNGIVTL